MDRFKSPLSAPSLQGLPQVRTVRFRPHASWTFIDARIDRFLSFFLSFFLRDNAFLFE
jgi:hypothetical protein